MTDQLRPEFDIPLQSEEDILNSIHGIRTTMAILLLPILGLVAALIGTIVFPDLEIETLIGAGGFLCATLFCLPLIKQFRTDIANLGPINERQFREVTQYIERYPGLKPYLRAVGKQGRGLHIFELIAIRRWVKENIETKAPTVRELKVDPYMVMPKNLSPSKNPVSTFHAVIDD